MTVLSTTQAVMGYASIFIFSIEIYLLLTNVTYVFFKLRYFQPPLLKYRYARSYRRLAEFSRTGAILLLLMYSAMEVCWASSSKINTEEICGSIFRVPSIYFYFLLNCRIFFAYARFAMFKITYKEEHKKETAGVYLIVFVVLIAIIWNQLTLRYEFDEMEKVCFIKTNNLWIEIFVPIWIVYEAISFALYYTPLKAMDGLSAERLGGWAKLLTTKNQELDDFQEGEWHGNGPPVINDQSSTRASLSRVRSTCAISNSSLELIREFHKVVRRHFWAGLAIAFTGTMQLIQFIVFDGTVSTSKFLGVPRNVRIWYFQSGIAQIACRGLGLILYISLMLSEDNSQRAFIPYIFWKNEPWE